MKNTILIFSLLFIAACGGKEKSIESLIEESNFEGLKTKKIELVNQIKDNEDKIAQINKTLEEEEQIQKLPLVSIYKIENIDFNHFVELQGSVETDQNIVVYAEVQGNIIDFKYRMGDKVSKGEVIAIIDDGGMHQQLAQAKQRAQLSKITYEKRKRLWEKNIGSEIDFLQAETQFKAENEAVLQLEKQVAKATVRAPFSGQIDEKLADEGQLVNPGQTPLFRIANLDNMYIHADVPERYIGSIEKGNVVWVDIAVLDSAIECKVSKVSNYISPDNRTFKVEIEVPNKEGRIKPNLTARLKINDYSNKEAILIPQSMISEDSEGRQYVYKANASKGSNQATAEKAFISTGESQGGEIEVIKGLNADDAIINEGARTVREGQEVEIIK